MKLHKTNKVLRFRIESPIEGYSVGDSIEIEANEKGIPLDAVWYRRFLEGADHTHMTRMVEAPKKKHKTAAQAEEKNHD